MTSHPPSIQSPLQPRLWRVGTLIYTSGGLATLFFWLLWGDFAWNIKERAVVPVAQLMLQGFSTPDWLVGLLVGSVPAGIGLILGPLVSVHSDRHRGRWGRRIPYLLIPTPFVTLAMCGLALTPAIGTWLHGWLGSASPGEMVCRISVFGFFWTVFEIGTITINTLFGALINDVVPHEIIGRFFALFRAVSLFAGIIFNYYLMGAASTYYLEIFIGLGLLYCIAFALMCFMVKEGEYAEFPSSLALGGARFNLLEAVANYIKECYTNAFYIWFFVATTLGAIALGPVNTFSIFHARSLEMSDDLYGKCLALSFAISLLLSYPLGLLADKFHPLRLGIGGMALYACTALLGFFFATSTWSFFAAFAVHTVVSGIYLTGTASIGQRLLPVEKFAQFSSAAGIIMAISYMILPPLLGAFIEVMKHEYRYVFLLGSIFAACSASAYIVLYRKYKHLGGDASYKAPE